VTLDHAGPVDDLAATGAVGPLAQLVVYRTVQEALANAVRHAPGAPCRVRLDARDGVALVVTVRNDAPPAGDPVAPHQPGYGLVGMRERAEVTGATLRYGPRAAGGWEVRLVVPAADRTTTRGDAP
jgi:signal transduction histidine kinase